MGSSSMPIVSLTRLQLRGFRYLLAFAWHSSRIARQARRAPGFLGGAVYGDPLRLTFWTATLWEDEAAMGAFRGSGDHRVAMPRLAHWCDEASVLHWRQAGSEPPAPEIMLRRMQSEGRALRVSRPSRDHAAGRIAPRDRPPAHANPLAPNTASSGK